MVALRRTLTVNCHRCGRSTERLRRADDLRTAEELLRSGRCGFCRARACDGEVEILPVEAPFNKHPGLILEWDGELHPRSRRNGGANAAAPLTLVYSRAAGPSVARHIAHIPAVGFAQSARRFSVLGLGAVLAAGAAVLLWNAVLVIGNLAGGALSYATSQPAREQTYDFANALERDAYCHAREYLINIRGANVPEATRELRRNVIEQCPELAALR